MATLHLSPDPLRMTTRARLYLLIAAGRHLALAGCCLFDPSLFDAKPFIGIKQAMPGPTSSDMFRWGVLFLCTGLLCTAAAGLAKAGVARWALIASIATTALLAGGFIAVTREGISAPTGLVGYVALTLKDLVVLRQPMRSPFEDLTRRVLAEPRR